jgi:hypothetical protein
LSADGVGFGLISTAFYAIQNVDGNVRSIGSSGPHVGPIAAFYSLFPLKLLLSFADRQFRRRGYKIVLTFSPKNGINIPHTRFYGLFVPF